ncbi:MAG: hypothetical protein IGS39_16325 [Calothrix sp. C42_A2020_038]|nr:hypothetical protein [Calothrix sp. C42_A2020_038]
MENQSQRTLEDLAMVAKQAMLRAKDNSLETNARSQALLDKQVALTKLINELMLQIDKLPKPQTDSSRYIYEEALQETCLYICKNIDKYESERGSIMGWFIFILKMRKISFFKWVNWDIISNYTFTSTGDEINLYDVYIPPELNPLPSEQLLAFIKEDPEGLLQRKLFKKNPNASFQTILLKKCEEGKSWQEIVAELKLGATHGPLYCFYQRCCEEFASYFTKYLCN